MFVGFIYTITGLELCAAARRAFAFAAEGRLLSVADSVPLPQTWLLFMQHDLTQSGWEPMVQSSFPVIIVVQSQSG